MSSMRRTPRDPHAGEDVETSREPGRGDRLRWFRYVRHAERERYEREGWLFADDLGPTHGRWSVLMEWPGPGEPP